MVEKKENLAEVIEQTKDLNLPDLVDPEFSKSAKVHKSKFLYKILRNEENRGFIRSPDEIDEDIKDKINIVIHMGCHSISTPHIIQATNDIVNELNYNSVSIGGFTNCCGTMDITSGNVDTAEQIDTNRFNNISYFDPEYALMECTACHAKTSKLSLGYQSPDFEVASMIRFLNERKNELYEHIKDNDPITVAFHDHFDENGWASDEEYRYARELFSKFPNIDIVELEHTCDESLPCSFLSDESKYDYADLNNQIFKECVEAGADTLVTFWHACNRSLAMDEYNYPVTVKNYATLIGERLGYNYRNKYKEYVHAGINHNTDWIVEDSRSVFEANGLNEAEAREIININFVPE